MSEEATRWAWGIRGLDLGPRVILQALAWIADATGAGEIKLETLGFMADCSRSTVQRHMRVLEDGQLVTREQQHGRGRTSRFQLTMPEKVSALTPYRPENVSENVSKNVAPLTRYPENVSTNVSALTPFPASTHAGAPVRGEVITQEEVFREERYGARSLNGRESPQGARAREVAAYEPAGDLIQHLLARGMTIDEVIAALVQWREVRTRNEGVVSDANFRVYCLQTYLPRILGRDPLPDMRHPAPSKRMAENLATGMNWQPPERRRQ